MNPEEINRIKRAYFVVMDRAARAVAGSGGGVVHVIAVSKSRTAEEIKVLYDLGHRDFGENYSQELIEKSNAIQEMDCPEIRWHFIGHLQTNKVKLILPIIDTIHSVDSLKLAREIQSQAEKLKLKAKVPIFIEVNLSGEKSKSGVQPEQVRALLETIHDLDHIDLRGLMCIPDPKRKSIREPFTQLRKLSLEMKPLIVGELSMGMSDDYEFALMDGATHIRVGTAIFGPRPT